MKRLLPLLVLAWTLACSGGADPDPVAPEPGEPVSDFVEPPPALLPAGEAAETSTKTLPRAAEPPLELATLSLPDADLSGAPAEAEPNDERADANPLGGDFTARGTLEGRDTDVFEWVVDEPGTWSVEVAGEGVNTARVTTAAGKLVELLGADSGTRQAHGVYVTPGRYFIEVAGKNGGAYTVRAVARGRPDPRTEREPNDDPGGAHALIAGETRGGWLNPRGDVDTYRFSLGSTAHIRLHLEVNAKTGVELRDQTTSTNLVSGELDGPGTWDAMLQPGEWQLSLKARAASAEPYRVWLERLDPFLLPDDLEPNDEPERAVPMAPSMAIAGSIGPLDRYDFYALPMSSGDAAFDVRWTGPADALDRSRVYLVGPDKETLSEFDKESGSWKGTVPGGAQAYLQVRKEGDYALELSLEGTAPRERAAAPAAQIQAPAAITQVAAYREIGQRLELPVVLQGSGSVKLETWISEHSWSATPSRTEVQVSGSTEIPIVVEIPADAPEETVWVTIAARSTPDGAPVTASFLVRPVCGAPLVAPFLHWSLPEALLGGIDVARADLGASIVAEDAKQRRRVPLIDGLTANDSGVSFREPAEATIALAGDRPEIAGFVIDAKARKGNALPRPFELQLSDDGTRFETVASGTFERHPGEQALVLDSPRRATHARLKLLADASSIGELKVIATPGSKPLGDTPLVISRAAHGGRFIRTRPYISAADDILGTEARSQRYRITPGEPMEMVLAFEHGRIARVGALTWEQPEGVHYPLRTKVTVAASTSSPVGPWTPVATWGLPLGEGETDTLELEQPAWARYLKITNLETDSRYGELPVELQVHEAPLGPDGRSVIGEYGKYSRNGPYELAHGLDARAALRGERGENDTLDTATPMELGTPVADQVSVGVDVDVYRIDIPEGHNALELVGIGEPQLNVNVRLLDGEGTEIPMVVDPGATGTRFKATVSEGPVYVEVSEPPRSVGLLWDQSGSVSAYIPQIYSAVTEFVEVVEPGKEVANLYPFQDKDPGLFLSDTWLDEPAELQRVLNGYDRSDSSSKAELALLSAVRRMEEREGTKGILILTDAETHSNARTPELWSRFAEVRPRVFTMELHIGNVRWHQDLMQGWADIDAGHYTWFSSATDLDRAFDRASCHLRRPQAYQLTATTEFEEPPEPGTIAVEPARLEGYAVELILDASGSMLKRQQGQSRIEIARNVLSDLVTNTIPADTPLALRVFGHRKPKSCQTDLEIPLAPLDPAQVKSRIGQIQAKNLARTPIGASLLAVESDLKTHDGPKLVVLLTDGEETCDGDPAAAIDTLAENGVDVRMNIVGFAIDDAALKTDFEAWAKSGGGVYLDAASEEELGEAMLKALSPKFQVIDAAGEVLVEGTAGGDPVDAPVGAYTVKVLTSPVQTFEVEVGSGQDVRLSLEQPE